MTAPEPDAFTAFSSPRRSMVASGTAQVIELPAPWVDHAAHAHERLARIEGSEHVVAFAALPFDRGEPARLVVPERTWIVDSDGERVRVEVGGSPLRATATPDRSPATSGGRVSGARSEMPREIDVRAAVPPEQWCGDVREARDAIRRGELTKVVLARAIDVSADVPLDDEDLFTRLRSSHPGAFCFAVDRFVGASPELLVSRRASTVRARPMAGTTTRTGHPEVDQRAAGELLASDKNRREHQVTIDAVHDALLGWCSYLDAEPAPSVVQAGPVQHLATMVEGHLGQPEPSVLELVAALHPTPAVGGHPTAVALQMRERLEQAGRGRYAGPVGWLDASGNGTFAVGIRAIQLDDRGGRLFAGVGVVADSDPEAELEETRSKAQAVLSAVVRI